MGSNLDAVARQYRERAGISEPKKAAAPKKSAKKAETKDKGDSEE
jgi:hypothetical protein